jgi:hypothetical protein
MQSVALGTGTVVEIVSAYSATAQSIESAENAPAWQTIGAFYMPADAAVKLEAIGAVSAGGLVMSARLLDVSTGLPVSGSTTADNSSLTVARQISGAFTLPGRKVYEIQSQCVGVASESGIIYNAGLVNG